MKENQSPKMPKPGEVYEIPPQGSLGLLAAGYEGLLAWRKKRSEFIQAQTEKKNSQHEGK
jgi:hypothetical protein